jgi:hypothetical protein
VGALVPVTTFRCYDGAPMPVQALCALQNGFMGAQRSLLFYGEYSGGTGLTLPR